MTVRKGLNLHWMYVKEIFNTQFSIFNEVASPEGAVYHSDGCQAIVKDVKGNISMICCNTEICKNIKTGEYNVSGLNKRRSEFSYGKDF